MKITHIPLFLIAQTVLLSAVGTAGLAESLPDKDKENLELCKSIMGNEKIDSFLPVYKDISNDKLYVEIPKTGSQEFLYEATLTSGFGSRDIDDGDRGSLGSARGGVTHGRLVSFRRYGNQVLLIERNTTYYTPNVENPVARDQKLYFPDAILARFNVACHDDKNIILDATSLFLQDGLDE